jgi:hypothetical protein
VLAGLDTGHGIHLHRCAPGIEPPSGFGSFRAQLSAARWYARDSNRTAFRARRSRSHRRTNAPHIGGLLIQTNQKSFVEENTPRSRAIWEAALQELEAAGLIADRGYKREIFEVTRQGYDVAELLHP